MGDVPEIGRSGVVVRVIEPADLPQLQRLCERSADYYEAVTAGPPGPSEAHGIFTILPPEKDYDDKLLFGLWAGESLIGAIDVVRDYPTDSVWMIGLVLLDPDWRGRGLGRDVVEGLLAWMAAKGAATARIAVRQGYKAGGFWEKLGFGRIETIELSSGLAAPAPFDIMTRSVSDAR